jgi:hypothetical protein
MFQLKVPLVRIVVGGDGWKGPVGSGVANFVEPGHRDEDLIWVIDMDSTGQTWCVSNRYVRAPRNITYGRTSDTIKAVAVVKPGEDTGGKQTLENNSYG